MSRMDFLLAAANGNLKVVDKFLEDGGDPNTHDEVFLTCCPSLNLD